MFLRQVSGCPYGRDWDRSAFFELRDKDSNVESLMLFSSRHRFGDGL